MIISQSVEDQEAALKVVSVLFGEFQVIYPMFKTVWPTEQLLEKAKRSWLKAFSHAGITKLEQLKNGIIRCRESDKPFVPSVGQFISWCRTPLEEIGLPDVEEAFLMSIEMNRKFSDYQPPSDAARTVIGHVLNEIGSFNYRLMKEEKARKAFGYHYSVATAQFRDGKLQIIPKAIQQDAPRSAPERLGIDGHLMCQELLKQIRGML